MFEPRVNGEKSLLVSLSLLAPSLEDPGVSSGPIRHVRRKLLYILSRIDLRLSPGSKEIAELCLKRVQIMESHFQPPCHGPSLEPPGFSSTCIPTCLPPGFVHSG